MSEIGDAIQEKCLAFGDRIIKLNDYLLSQACKMEDVRCKKDGGGHRNHYLDDKQYTSLHEDCEELVKVLVHRCKKLDEGKDG